MLNHIVIKWLIITTIVLIGFLAVLLLLGYLLKENEEKTARLITQIEQETYQQQEQKMRKSAKPYLSSNTLSTFEKSKKKVIENNLYCQSSNQCFVVQTYNETIGCIVAINTTGAAILLKITSQGDNEYSTSKKCQKVYQAMNETLAQCRNNRCTL
jgi:DNA-directed RNA polymerase beta' subunit